MPPENKSATSTSPTIGFHQLRQAWEISSLRETLARREQDISRLQGLIEREVERVRKLFSALEPHELTDATIITPILSEAVAALIDVRDASRRLDERFDDDSLVSPSADPVEQHPPAPLPTLPVPPPLMTATSRSSLSPAAAAALLARAPYPYEPEAGEAKAEEAEDMDPEGMDPEELAAQEMEDFLPPPAPRPRPSAKPPRPVARSRPEPATPPAPPEPRADSRPVSWLLQPVNPPTPQPVAPSDPTLHRPRTQPPSVPVPAGPLNARTNPASPSSSINWLKPAGR